ncbi:Retrovirus-related Pol polyprotein from transposon 297 [Vitis vinifera]|uniref:Retrovirus-related Pol polyprotein from transposon 297 n=1 Tax=Vitis vinifera TaxID=29760 RepID=A0A438HP64_VITVI|nr:Retrovirus-related Pol polyprotein from transposon 297 [Vitis vinifera]
MEEEAKPIRQPQRRLNPHLQEVVRTEVLKLLQAGIIYPISDSPWVSPTQVVPKKSGITVVQNEKGEEIATRLTSGWRVCINYRKLNTVTRKDHFPLPFIDQVLERVSGHPFYCFLDGYSGYFQIEIDVEDQEKTTFTCPFGTYAYRRMPFSLCNAPATFQRCMLSIFNDMVERIMEVFIDDITIYGGTFEECLVNLEAVLNRCIEKDLVLNWEKMPFYGVVLGQREYGKPYVIYYASKTLNEAQRNYTTTEKELLVVVFALDKFSAYLVGSFIIVFTDHSALKDKKGVENVVADHLSRLAIAHNSHVLPINDDFPEESLMLLEKALWYALIANYLVTGEVPSEWKAQDRKHFFAKIHAYYWEEPFLFKYCADQIIRNHEGVAIRVYLAIAFQRFPHHGIDFMGPFPMSFGNSYILVGVDYVSKWVEVIPCKHNDHKVALKFLKENIFSRFGVPKAIISDGGTHFCNKPFETLLAKYGVKHKVATPYHPQTSGASGASKQGNKKHIDESACHLPVEVEYKAWWAIKRLNMDLIRTGAKRCLDLNEMEELRNDAYINSKVAKQRMKKWQDQLISNKELRNGQKVLLYDSRLHIFPRKLKSRWIGAQAQHTPILRQIQHHLGITSAPEHAIPSSSEPSQAPHFVDQSMPHQEPPIGEAAEHHSTSFRTYHFLPIFQSLLSH